MFVRFIVDDVVDSGGLQRIGGRGLHGERFTDDFRLIRPQYHGDSSVPMPGAVGLAVFPFGDRQRGYVLGLESTGLRPKSQPAGAKVIYGANGEIVSLINSKIRIVAADVEIDGKIALTGTVLTHNGVDISDKHKHQDVTPGAALTGVPA